MRENHHEQGLENKVEILTAVLEARMEALASTVVELSTSIKEHKTEVTRHIQQHTEAHTKGAERAHVAELDIASRLTKLEQTFSLSMTPKEMEHRIVTIEATIKLTQWVMGIVVMVILGLISTSAGWFNALVHFLDKKP